MINLTGFELLGDVFDVFMALQHEKKMKYL